MMAQAKAKKDEASKTREEKAVEGNYEYKEEAGGAQEEFFEELKINSAQRFEDKQNNVQTEEQTQVVEVEAE